MTLVLGTALASLSLAMVDPGPPQNTPSLGSGASPEENVAPVQAEAGEPIGLAAESPEELLIIIEDDAGLGSAPAQEPKTSVSPLRIESSLGTSLGAVSGEFQGAYRLRLIADLLHDARGEDIVELWNRLSVATTVRSRNFSARVSARLVWGVRIDGVPVTGTERSDDPALRLDLRESEVTWRLGSHRIRAGLLQYRLGQLELFAAADVINPFELDVDPLIALTEPNEVRTPVPALDWTVTNRQHAFTTILIPFFIPNRLSLFGSDFSVFPPGTPGDVAYRVLAGGGDAVRTVFQDGLTTLGLPDASPLNASGALRYEFHSVAWDVAATTYFGWDRLPTVRPTLLPAVVAERGLEDVVRYRRFARAAVEVNYARGAWVWHLDVGASPLQTWYTERYESVRLFSTQASLGLEWQYSSQLTAQVTATHLGAWSPPPSQSLLGLEAPGPLSSDRPVAQSLVSSGTITWSSERGTWRAVATVLARPIPGDGFASGLLAYKPADNHEVALVSFFAVGREGTLLQDYSVNASALLQYGWVW